MTRRTFELSCRLVAFAALVAAFVSSWRAAGRSHAAVAGRIEVRTDSVGRDTVFRDSPSEAVTPLMSALVTRETRGGEDTLTMSMRALPSPGVRAALASLRAAGVPFVWYDGTGARGLAASLSRVAAPGAPLDLRVSVGNVTNGSPPLVVRDSGGVLDSLVPAEPSLSWRLGSVAPPLRVSRGKGALTVALTDSVPARRVLVMAQPGWEGKFVVAALEESGWLVDGSMRVSPTGAVTIGTPQRLDTARYAAVVLLDSMPVDGGALTRFVASGGGLVLGGDALRIPALAALRPGRATAVRGAIAGGLLADSPRRGLEAWEVEPAADAVVLELDRGDHAHDEPALLARRFGAGRVVATPYRESWRWRMQGTDDGAADHRGWWHDAVAAATGTPATTPAPPVNLPGDAAPYADLVARAGRSQGAPRDEAAVTVGRDGGAPASDIPLPLRPWALLTTALLALLAEWTSRRLRGAR